MKIFLKSVGRNGRVSFLAHRQGGTDRSGNNGQNRQPLGHAQQLTEEQQVSAGVRPDFVRLSVGLEDLDDILWDLDQALSA